MEVTCPKCRTAYDFEDTLIGPKGTVVRCTQCGHMFKIFKGPVGEGVETAGWMVRKKTGSVFNVDRFSTLQKWILEGKVSTQDELSRTGKTWKRIGDIVELSGLFKLAHLEAEARGEPHVEGDTDKFDKRAGIPSRKRLEPRASVTPMADGSWKELGAERDTLPYKEPSPEFRQPEEGTTKGPLARTLDAGEAAKEAEEGESILKPVYQPARGKKIAVVVIVLIVLVPLVYLGFYYRGRILDWAGMLREPHKEDTGRDDKLAKAGDLLRAGTEAKMAKAEKLYKAVLEDDTNSLDALVGLSEIYSLRAQRLKDRIDFPQVAGVEGEKSPGLQAEFMSMVIRARDYARDAVEIDPESNKAQRAIADALRLSGELKAAAKAASRALDLKPNDAKAIYIQAMIDFDQDGDADNAIEGMRRALRKDEKLTAVRFRLALFLVLDKNADEAKKELARVLKEEDHARARDLLEALEKGKLLASATGDASTDADAPAEAAGEAARTVASTGKEAAGAQKAGGGAPPAGRGYDYYYKTASKSQSSGNYSKAVEYFRKALDEQPSSAEAWAGIGHCHRDMGSAGQAINDYRKALKYNSRFGPAIIGLAEIYKQQQKYKLSLQYYKKYLQVFSSGPQVSIARRNVEELEDLLKAKGISTEGAVEEEEEEGSGAAVEEQETGEGGPAVIETTEEEIKSSIGQPTSDTPKTEGDPYD